jgi:hypothetical protein
MAYEGPEINTAIANAIDLGELAKSELGKLNRERAKHVAARSRELGGYLGDFLQSIYDRRFRYGDNPEAHFFLAQFGTLFTTERTGFKCHPVRTQRGIISTRQSVRFLKELRASGDVQTRPAKDNNGLFFTIIFPEWLKIPANPLRAMTSSSLPPRRVRHPNIDSITKTLEEKREAPERSLVDFDGSSEAELRLASPVTPIVAPVISVVSPAVPAIIISPLTAPIPVVVPVVVPEVAAPVIASPPAAPAAPTTPIPVLAAPIVSELSNHAIRRWVDRAETVFRDAHKEACPSVPWLAWGKDDFANERLHLRVFLQAATADGENPEKALDMVRYAVRPDIWESWRTDRKVFGWFGDLPSPKAVEKREHEVANLERQLAFPNVTPTNRKRWEKRIAELESELSREFSPCPMRPDTQYFFKCFHRGIIMRACTDRAMSKAHAIRMEDNRLAELRTIENIVRVDREVQHARIAGRIEEARLDKETMRLLAESQRLAKETKTEPVPVYKEGNSPADWGF